MACTFSSANTTANVVLSNLFFINKSRSLKCFFEAAFLFGRCHTILVLKRKKNGTKKCSFWLVGQHAMARTRLWLVAVAVLEAVDTSTALFFLFNLLCIIFVLHICPSYN